ncbi:MAG: hypothetical protein AB1668_03790 [Nanoarchaeota archaeon]
MNLTEKMNSTEKKKICRLFGRRPMGRKGQAVGINMIDLVLLFFSGIIAYFVISLILFGGLGTAEKASLDKVGQFKRVDSAIRNIYVQLYEGEEVKAEEVDEKIANSKVLGGRTITDCSDYFDKEDCNSDLLGISKNQPNYYCKWDDSLNKCGFEIKPSVMAKEIKSGGVG